MSEYVNDPPVEERLGEVLREEDETLAVAESCTGGLVGSLLTDIPGASDYFDRGICAYSYEAKMHHLGVNRETLEDHGAVSKPVARQMAAGARDISGTTWGVSTTGIAGPSGGTSKKPVGTVFVGVAYRGEWGTDETETHVEHYEFVGDRRQVKTRIARQALTDLLVAVEER